MEERGVPEKITIDGSAANEAAITSYNKEHGTTIDIRKIKYLNNIVEQDEGMQFNKLNTCCIKEQGQPGTV
jgi:transposase-like protein